MGLACVVWRRYGSTWHDVANCEFEGIITEALIELHRVCSLIELSPALYNAWPVPVGPAARRRGTSGGATYSTSPSEAMCEMDVRNAVTSKTVKAALPVLRDDALLGHVAPCGQSPSQ
jgi:hypothetical protein